MHQFQSSLITQSDWVSEKDWVTSRTGRGVAEFSQAEFKNSVIISLYCFAIKILLRILFSQQNFVRILISQQNFVSLSTPTLVSKSKFCLEFCFSRILSEF